jgi:hypothetical protein
VRIGGVNAMVYSTKTGWEAVATLSANLNRFMTTPTGELFVEILTSDVAGNEGIAQNGNGALTAITFDESLKDESVAVMTLSVEEDAAPVPPAITSVNIRSSNGYSRAAATTVETPNTITLVWQVDKPLASPPVVTIEGQAVEAVGPISLRYTATVTASDSWPEGPVSFSIDCDGTIATETTDNSHVVFDASPAVISDVKLYVSEDTPPYTVLQFTVNEPLYAAPIVRMGGEQVTPVKIDDLNWMAAVPTSEVGWSPDFRVAVRNMAGLVTYADESVSGALLLTHSCTGAWLL